MTQILHISDTHHHIDLLAEVEAAALQVGERMPDALPDLVIHTGDIMGSGFNVTELDAFLGFVGTWSKLDVPVVLVPGNHDRPFHREHFEAMAPKAGLDSYEADLLLDKVEEIEANCHVLINDYVDVVGLKVFGFSWQPPFHNWAFNAESRRRHALLEASLPNGKVDVLALHAPPQGILDATAEGHAGDEVTHEMLKSRTDMPVVLLGHIHEQGMRSEWREVGGYRRYFHNGSMLDGRYRPILDTLRPFPYWFFSLYVDTEKVQAMVRPDAN